LARRPEGIFVNPFEQGEIGPDLFRKACEFGLEGLVSKHRDRPYQGGLSKHWVKVKYRKHPAKGAGDGFVWITVHPRNSLPHASKPDRQRPGGGRGRLVY
jgi:bifunctional non-homologous end joining protein LigD